MKICDITLAYTETSGGIRTYLDAKREHLLRHTPHEHVLIVPGEHDRQERSADGRAVTHWVASPPLPGCEPYRFFWRPGPITKRLREEAPDLIEIGSFYVAPWAALRHRRLVEEAGGRCAVSAFFHTDVADAYVGGPLRDALDDCGEAVERIGEHAASIAQRGAEQLVGAALQRCDLRLAASPDQAARLADYGVDASDVVPLGVDLERFNPAERSREVRDRMGVQPQDLVLIYAGRFDYEKRVELLTEAVDRLPGWLRPRLFLLGEGPLRNSLEEHAQHTDRVTVLPYEDDPDRFAKLLTAADVYVTAGPHETFGFSVIEAQASGLPVVGVDAGALRERVDERTGRLGPVDDAAAFAENIARVADDREALGRAARRHVEENFGWHSTFRRLLRLYERALAKRSAPSHAGA